MTTKIKCANRTNQRVFNVVWSKLNLQSRPAIYGKGNSTYLGARGLRCAAGHLLPQNLNEAETKLIQRVRSRLVFEVQGIIDWGCDLRFLEEIQCAHDLPATYYPSQWLSAWREEMAHLAKQYKLKVPPIPKGCPK